MKEQHHIDRLTRLLNSSKKILREINALVIDDEADNASLNTLVNEDNDSTIENESRIYNAIKNLRKSLPKHSLLQYTATPQALLLASGDDQYRPQKVRFVSPGKGYVGNAQLFFQNSTVS